MLYCPACDNPYPTWVGLRDHLKKAEAEGDQNHIDIIQGEEWDLSATSVAKASTDEV